MYAYITTGTMNDLVVFESTVVARSVTVARHDVFVGMDAWERYKKCSNLVKLNVLLQADPDGAASYSRATLYRAFQLLLAWRRT
jgi:hypothetical protein